MTILSSHIFNILLSALFFLLVMLLYFYARFFWSPSRQQITSGGFDGGVSGSATSDENGLDPSVISSIPLFVYEADETEEEEEECVICLSLWEVGEFGRKLRNCNHMFHVECIDMWLSSCSTCPLCRSHVLNPPVNNNNGVADDPRFSASTSGIDDGEGNGVSSAVATVVEA